MPLVKNSEHIVKILGYSSEGAGVARIDGQVVFIPGTILGERCRIKIVKANKNIAYGRLMQVEERSAHRVESECPYYPKCGGCDFWHMDYEAELEAKWEHVHSVITRIGGIETEVSPIIGAQEIMRYRNKAQFPVGRKENKIVSGFYRAHSHDIVPCNDCKIQSQFANKIQQIVLEWMQTYSIPPYDEQSGRGILRHIYVRNRMVCLVVTQKPRYLEEFVCLVLQREPQTSGILLNYHTAKTNVILGNRLEKIYGEEVVFDVLCGNEFEIAPHAFYQVNHAQAEVLYALAIEAAGLCGEETVLDLYCGAGTITLALATHAKRVIGIEIIPQAIENARKNAVRNKLKNVEFLCADATKAVEELQIRGIHVDVIVVDPPRKGLTRELIATIDQFSPKRVVYVSCDPATLARDLKIFCTYDYKVMKITPVDMFPRTRHVETVVLLSKGEVDSKKVRVEFSLEDMNMSEFQDGATYTQIKDYVLEHSGLKVSSLYISQIKRKCGIEVGKNYNQPKSEDSRQPQCPPEKEKAIREAFKYYGMI